MANAQMDRALRFPRTTSKAEANNHPAQDMTDAIGQPSWEEIGPLRTKTVPTKAEASTPSRSIHTNTYAPVPETTTITNRPAVDGELDWYEVADQGGKTKRSRLPAEGQRHAQPAVRIPQRKLSVVNLRPRLIDPWNEDSDLVSQGGVMNHGAMLGSQSNRGENVSWTQVDAMDQSRYQYRHPCSQYPRDAEDVR